MGLEGITGTGWNSCRPPDDRCPDGGGHLEQPYRAWPPGRRESCAKGIRGTDNIQPEFLELVEASRIAKQFNTLSEISCTCPYPGIGHSKYQQLNALEEGS
ncbi:unnamed protein product [Fraxinus pennsylvanica]|uniref:Uncharacterized protein n=1 Tax=Fraxinus pennsylvanica TaxID=56036 RepID=A0AAD2E4Y9_9LAMI|nr:unnamed protein product [Fraxinus pennsylvanica]